MDKKRKIRLIIYGVALIAVIIFFGFYAGVFQYWFTGYRAFFNKKVYNVRDVYMVGDYRIKPTDEEFTIKTFSNMDGKSLNFTVNVRFSQEKDQTVVVLTFKNDYSYGGGAIFSGTYLNGVPQSGKYPFEGLERKTTTVTLISGETEINCALYEYKNSRKKSVLTFKTDDVSKIDEIKISGFVLTEAQVK